MRMSGGSEGQKKAGRISSCCSWWIQRVAGLGALKRVSWEDRMERQRRKGCLKLRLWGMRAELGCRIGLSEERKLRMQEAG